MSLLKILIGKFIKIDIIRTASSLVDVDNNQLGDANVFIGFITRQELTNLEREGDVSPSEKIRGYGSLMNVQLITFGQNFPLVMISWCMHQFQRETWSILLLATKTFFWWCGYGWDIWWICQNQYQLLKVMWCDVPQHVRQSVKEKSEGDESEGSTFICMDVVWAFLSNASTGDVMVVG